MNSSKYKIFFLILFCFNFSYSSDLSVGDSCTLKSGASGTCQEWKECSIIRDLWKRRAISRAHVTICSQPQRTVCCPFSLDDETTTERTTTTTTTQAAIESHDDNDQERISQIKCKEYGKKAMLITVLTPLLGQEPIVTSTSKCTHKSVSLIVGGTDANVDEFPHQALLGYSPRNTEVKWLCGGSLVSPNFVLTAAHCLFEKKNGQVKKVKLGMRNKDQDHDNRKVFIYNIKETFKHPNYNERTFNEDIALLKLDGTVPIDEHILPICLPTEPSEDLKAIATGFGNTKSGSQSDVLLKVTLERFTHDECRESWPEDGNIQIDENTMLCYGHHTQRKDICRGDSGGPIQVSNENNVHCTYKQIGISSFGPNRCGTVSIPSGYTNVYNYLDWIENIVWGDEQ
ncbi:venom protease-like [Chironomus tepperi]|uniref:venom protease-like n=1 Tax=Chironomus tepperi TaxID=113505 RepID=UPI00391F31E9